MTGNEPDRSLQDRLDAERLQAMRQELGADPVILEKAVRCLDLAAAACSVEQESRFAGTAYGVEAVAGDLVNFARLVSMLDLKGAFVHRLRRGAPEAAVYWCAYLAPEVFEGLG